MRAKLSQVPLYPFMLGVYPVLMLWQQNFTQVPAFVIFRSLLLAISVSAAVYVAFWVIIRDLRKSSAVASLFLLLFFSYGHVFDLLRNSRLTATLPIQHRHVLLLWVCLFILGVVLVLRTKSDLRNLTRIGGQVSIFLIAVSLVSLAYEAVGQAPPAEETYPNDPPAQNTQSPKRDVYYILVDSYPRQDWLAEHIGQDNREFLASLESLGFVLPACTQSNYDNTVYSMTATLNMDYLDQLGFSYPDLAASPGENGYKTRLTPLLHSNRVMRLFRSAGYKIVTFETPYPFVDFPDSDIVYDVEAGEGIFDKLESLNFQYWLMRTSLMLPLIERLDRSPELLDRVPPILQQFVDPRDSTEASRKYKQYRQNLFALESLEQVPQAVAGSKFVYAHLLSTHPPFTFNLDGSYRAEPSFVEDAFEDQIAYTNQRLLGIVATILSQYKDPPIIVIQGDHAMFYGDSPRFRILNAYYLPDMGRDLLPSGMTPANTFRLIFSKYFGRDYPLLVDQSMQIGGHLEDGLQIIPATCTP